MKKMRKNFFTFLLAVILLFSMLPAGTFAGAADDYTVINGEDWSDKSSNEDGSILWDANTATLTLNNAALDSWTQINFADLSKTLTVKVEGNNTINSDGVGIKTNANMLLEAEEGGSLTVNSNVENNCFYVEMGLTIRGGTYNLTSEYPAFFVTQDIVIDGAEVTASSSNDVAIYSMSGNVTVENGASVTVPYTLYSAIYAQAGNVTVTGQGTNADLKANVCAISGVKGVEISDGATVTGESATDSAIYSDAGNITVTGQGTKADLTASICALNGVSGVEISDGATVTGVSAANSAIYSQSGNVTITGQNTKADITAYYCAAQGTNDVTIENGATFIGVSTNDSAIYTQSGKVTITGKNTNADLTAYYCAVKCLNDVEISGEATVTGVSTNDSAIYAPSGKVTITGQNTKADLTAYYCAVKCLNDVEVSGGATLIGVSTDSAIYSEAGNVIITGQNTNADITARYCAVNSTNDVKISDGAVFNGISNENSVIYSSSGSITLDGAEATLESKKEKMGGLFMTSDTKTLTIKDSTLKVETLGNAISSYGYIDVIDSVLTINSQGANSINGRKDVTITGSKTSVTAQSAYPFYGGTITIREAAVSSESVRSAFGAANAITISDGANVKAKTTDDRTAVVCENGDIVLEGDHTSVEVIAAQTYGFTSNNGRIFLNAGHIKANTLEGKNVILARESGKESNTERPETRIIIGENFSAGESIVVTTVWKQADDGTYYADTLLVPKGTQLNSEGLLEGEYVRANDIEIAKKAPDAPTVDNLTDSSVTLTAVPGYEYRMDDGTWQEGNIFTNLEPNSTHNFYQRIAESDLTYASFESEALTVTTKKSTVLAPDKPTVDSVTDRSVTLKTVVGCEYSKDGTIWQDSPEFTDLQPNTEYSFYQRMKETNTQYASDKSAALTVTTKKSTVLAPAKPTVDSVADKSVTLKTVTGCEYSKDGTIWQDSPEFTDLQPNTEYSFYQRMKETNTQYASDKSAALTVTTKKSTALAPAKPTVDSVTDKSVTLKTVTGCEYSKDGIIWQDSPEFTDLKPNTEYSFYQRMKETNTQYASDKSAALTVTTKKSTVLAPAKPTVDSVTDRSVTLKTVVGCEYSKDGIIWQDSPEFTDLQPNTEYSFYQRIKETDTQYASDKSAALTVTTKKSTVLAPAKPTVDSVTDKSVTLKTVVGCEYSKDGIIWQDSPEFTDLQPNTEYSFYQRMKETDTQYASDKSAALTVTTKKSTVLAPAKPTVDSVTDRSVTLKTVTGCEYSKDGTIWQDSPEFTDLQPNTEYSFYQRMKETNTQYASDKSAALTVTTKKSTALAPAKPTVDSVTDKSVTLKTVVGCEYSKDGTIWQDSPEFTDLQPNTEYSFYQRVKGTDTQYASDKSPALTVRTMPDNTVVILNGATTATVDSNIEFTVNISDCNSNVTSVGVDVIYSDNFELVSGDWLKTGYSTKDFTPESNNGVLVYEKPSDVNGDLIKIVLRAKTASVDAQTVSVKVVAKNGSNEIINVTSSKSVKINCATHSYDSYTKKDDENHTCICSVCGNVETRAHRWDSGQQTKAPNCKETGNMLYTCLDKCGATKNDTLAKTDNHTYGSWSQTKAPTCTENGTETRTCSVCQNKETRDIKAAGHSFGSWKTTKEPTYKASGEQTRNCSKCSYKETRTIPKLTLNIGAGADGKKAEQTIIKSKNDKDPKGSTFNLLQVKNTKTTKNSIKITYKKPSKTKKFVIYGNMCGKSYKKLKTTTGKSFTYKKLKKGKYYKFLVMALDKKGKVVSTSKTIHVATKGGKVGNTKKITITNAKSTKTIKKGKTFKLKTKLTAESKKLKVKEHRKVAFESSKTSIAKVSKKGKITAKKKGTCYIYAYAQNGVMAKIKISVK